MPRYHFGSVDGELESDEEGTELRDIEAARFEAIKYAAEVLRSDPAIVWHNGQSRVEVTDEAVVLLFTLLTLAIDAPKPR